MKRINHPGGGTSAASADKALAPLSLFWFSAQWCGPCKQMAPAAAQVAELYQDRINVQKVDVDENPQLTSRFNIRGVPTLILAREDQVVAQQVGAAPLTFLTQWLDKHLEASTEA